jgi:uncharacterized protein YhaN
VRLTAFHIDGFGIFCDQGLGEIVPGLTLFQGANEAGKSTLLAFLRAVPYGFERGASRYEPLAGGNHGGRTEFVTADGRQYRLERVPARRLTGEARLTDLGTGEQLGGDALVRVLGNTPLEAYCSVYAFSIAELQRLESLTTEQVRSRIWTAGLGLGEVSIVDVESDVRKRKEELYASRASKRPINETLRALRDTRKALRAAGEELPAYESQRVRAEELEANLAELESQREQLERRLQRLEQYEKAWPIWVTLRADRAALAELPPGEVFPTDGVQRLEALQEKQEALTGELGEASDQMAALREEQEALEIDRALVERRDEIEAIARMERELRTTLGDLPKVQGEAAAQETQLAEDLRDLGPDWDEERLRTFDASAAVTTAARELEERLRDGEAEVAEAEREVGRRARAVESAEKALEQDRSDLGELPAAPVSDPEALRQRLAMLATARQAVQETNAASADISHLEDRCADLERQKAAAAARRDEMGPVIPVWLGPVIGAAVAVAMIAVSRSPVVISAGLVLGAVIGGALNWLGSRLDRTTVDRRLRAEEEVAQVEEAIGETQQRKQDAQARLSEAQAGLADAAGELGTEIGGPAHVERIAQQLEDARTQLEHRREAERQVERAEAAFREAQEDLGRAEQEGGSAGESLDTVRGEWRGWLERRELPAEMSPEAFREMVEGVRRLREGLKNLEQTRGRIQGMRRDVESIEVQAREVWDGCNRDFPPLHDLPNGIVALAGELRESFENAAKAEALERQIAQLQARLKRTEDSRAEVEGHIAALMEQTGAKSEEEFRRKGEVDAQRQGLQQSVSAGQTNLEHTVGVGEERSRFEQELEAVDPADTGPQIVEARQSLEAVRKQAATVNQELGSLRTEIERLAESANTARLTQDQERLRAQLREQIEQYGALSAALHLIGEARGKYERERQPAVLKEAGWCMERITQGAYQRVLSPLGEQDLSLEAADGRFKGIEELSRGTQQQLYLSMRMAYVRVHHGAPGAEPLPLIMDEVLVNFDPERARRAAELMLDVAQDNQVFVFTCHPETTELFRELEPGVPVVMVREGRIEPAS